MVIVASVDIPDIGRILSAIDVHCEDLALVINKQRGGLMIYRPTDFV